VVVVVVVVVVRVVRAIACQAGKGHTSSRWEGLRAPSLS
jgi:hypothetical protein